jgi:hypothetical protein
MSKRIFTNKQISKLIKNEYVKNCTSKSISYSGAFKLKALDQYQNKGFSTRQIFEQAGFDMDAIGKDTPKYCLKSWSRVAAKKALRY